MKKEPNIPTHKKVDFGIWEKMYGRTLSDEEKKEIGERMSRFFRLLIQEDLRQKKETHQKQIADLEKTATFTESKSSSIPIWTFSSMLLGSHQVSARNSLVR